MADGRTSAPNKRNYLGAFDLVIEQIAPTPKNNKSGQQQAQQQPLDASIASLAPSATTTATVHTHNIVGKTMPSSPMSNTKVSPSARKSSTSASMATAAGQPGTDAVSDLNRLFYEDQVFGWDRQQRFRFGRVLESQRTMNSDLDSDSEFDEPLKSGEVRVAWHPRGNEDVLPETEVGLADRTLVPGDVVRRVDGQQTRIGYCRSITASADLAVLGTSTMLRRVPTQRLVQVMPNYDDHAVCLDGWVGSTKDVYVRLVLRTECGARCEVHPEPESQLLIDERTIAHGGIYGMYAYHVGQKLLGSMQNLEHSRAKWLTDPPVQPKPKLAMRLHVIEADIEGILVQWMCKALAGIDDADQIELHKETQPKSLIKGDDLQRVRQLNVFGACMVQTNDMFYVDLQDADVAQSMRMPGWRRVCEQYFGGQDIKQRRMQRLSAQKAQKKGSSSTGAKHASNASVPKVTFRIDPAQHASNDDGGENSDSDEWITDEDDSDPEARTELLLKRLISNSVPKRNSPRPEFKASEHIGERLLVEVYVLYSTVTVVWQDGTEDHDIPSRDLFPLHHLNEHEFFPGDFVLSVNDTSQRNYGVVQRVDHVGLMATVKWFTTYTSADADATPTYNGETEVSVYELRDHPDFQFRPGNVVIRVANFVGTEANSTAGQVIDNFVEGTVKVGWCDDGHFSLCWPQDLFEVGTVCGDQSSVFGDYEDEYSDSDDSGADVLRDDGLSDSWETDSAHSSPDAGERQSPFFADDAAVDRFDVCRRSHGGSASRLSALSAAAVGEAEQPIHYHALLRTLSSLERLKTMLKANPRLEGFESLTKLLQIYKRCRFFDRLLGTQFFSRDRFMDLILMRNTPIDDAAAALAYSSSTASLANQQQRSDQVWSRVIDHKKRLFGERTDDRPTALVCATSPTAQHPLKMPPMLSPSPSMYPKQKSAKSPFNRSTSSDVVSGALQMLQEQQELSGGEDDERSTAAATSMSNDSGIGPNVAVASSMAGVDRSESVSPSSKSMVSDMTDADANSSGATGSADTTMSANAADATSQTVAPSANSGEMLTADAMGDELLSPYVCARLCALLLRQLRATVDAIGAREFKRHVARKLTAVTMQAHAIVMETGHQAGNRLLGDADEPEEADMDMATIRKIASLAASEFDTRRKCKCGRSVDDDKDESENDQPADDEPANATNDVNLSENNDCAAAAPESAQTLAPGVIQAPDSFAIMEKAPDTHRYAGTLVEPVNPAQYMRAVSLDLKLLRTALPANVWVRGFADRMDLLSVMMIGPAQTPYEDGVFLFDVQLGADYKRSPPLFQYISFCSDRLNPNLYEEGKVCVSLLGTWSGKDNEVWCKNSTLLQVIVSIQGLILVAEPYYNEAGYEKQKSNCCKMGKENARMYNEMVIIKVIQSMTKMLQHPGDVFGSEIRRHFLENGRRLYDRANRWIEMSYAHHRQQSMDVDAIASEQMPDHNEPKYPLLPASRGFCITLANYLEAYRVELDALCNTQAEANKQ